MEKEMTKAQVAALKAFPAPAFVHDRCVYRWGYKQAEEDIINLIESRISEIMGDAQPKPALRAELQELINKIDNNAQ